MLLVLISVTGWVDFRDIVRSEGFYVNENFQWHKLGSNQPLSYLKHSILSTVPPRFPIRCRIWSKYRTIVVSIIFSNIITLHTKLDLTAYSWRTAPDEDQRNLIPVYWRTTIAEQLCFQFERSHPVVYWFNIFTLLYTFQSTQLYVDNKNIG